MKEKALFHIIKLFIFFFFISSLEAFDPIIIQPNTHSLAVLENLYLYETNDHNLEIRDIINLDIHKWKKLEPSELNFGFSKKIYWIGLRLKRDFVSNEKYYLELNTSRIDHLEFYFNENGGYNKFSAGLLENFYSRPIHFYNPVFELNFSEKNEEIVYFKFYSKTSIQFPLIIHTYNYLQKKISKELILYGLFLGILTLSVLYGIMLYGLMMDDVHLYFALFSFFSLIFFLVMTGIGFQYCWPGYPFFNHLNPYLVLISTIFGFQFLKYITDVELNYPKVNKFIKHFTWIQICTFFFIFFIPFAIGLILIMMEVFVFGTFMVCFGLYASMNRSKTGIYIFTASLLWFSEWFFRFLHYNAILNFNFSLSDTIYLRCMERIILCLALLVKVKEIKEDNERIQEERLSLEIKTQERLSRINQEMELQVEERTRDLAKEKEIAVRANQLKDHFVTSVSHDLKSPLLNIRNLINIMIKKEKLSEEERIIYLQHSHSLLTNSYNMVHNILNADRFESGSLEIVHEYVDLNFILKNVLQELEYSIRLKNLRILFVEKEDSIVIGDSQLISQMFINIFTNAIKYSHENGRLEISISEKDQYIEISIKDFGIGMSTVELNQIRAGQGSIQKGTKGEEGTGFGIGIVKKILDLHGADFDIQSEQNEGTQFTVRFPSQDNVLLIVSEKEDIYQKLYNLCQGRKFRLLRIYELRNLKSVTQNISPDLLIIFPGQDNKPDWENQEILQYLNLFNTIIVSKDGYFKEWKSNQFLGKMDRILITAESEFWENIGSLLD